MVGELISVYILLCQVITITLQDPVGRKTIIEMKAH